MSARLCWLFSWKLFGVSPLAMCLFFGLQPALVRASGPEIEFDLVPVVECRDVTPPEFAATHPDQRVIEAVLRISMRLKSGSAHDVREITLEVASRDQSLLVFDYCPNLVLESDVAGEIEITKTHETGSSIGAGITGGTGIPYGGVNVNVSPNATVGTSKRDQLTETAKRIPDKDVVLVGGTMDSGYGVFFKFRPSGQTPVEGRKEFVCRYVVPRTWRGDWLAVSIHAIGEHKEYFLKSIKPSGAGQWELGLFLAGDKEARSAAWQLAATQGLVSPRQVEAYAQREAAANSAAANSPAMQQVQLSSKRALVTHTAMKPVAEPEKETKSDLGFSDFVVGMVLPHYADTKRMAEERQRQMTAKNRPLTQAEHQQLAREALRRLSQTR